MKVAAFILVGGRSSRFAGQKAAAELGGISIIRRIADAIRAALSVPVILVAADEAQLLTSGAADMLEGFVFDIFEGRGPAGGLHAALANTDADWAFVTACDIPFLSPELILLLRDRISEDIDAIVPIQPDGRPQPLAAFYRVATVRDELGRLLERPRPALSLREVLGQLDVVEVGFDDIKDLPGSESFFVNINSQEHLKTAEQIVRSGKS